ncbi:hypothetical protein [Flavobacterium eburneipallidum]|uniref:hypothetical protein n=1 Tax=Flavobacterium eburneipallidum TaxID=3003263 RepID=UPI002482BCC1|nr:hypothetical protein [Flavobacterium eburneipallidum]
MKKIIYFFLIFNFNFCFSQFGIINDLDGFVNVRSSAEKGKNISDKLENGFIVFYFEPKGNWVNIDYKKNGKQLNGYIYKDRIKYINDFTNVPLKSNLNGKVKLENENVKIEISETKFIKEKHNLKFHKNDKSILEEIDNMQIFGKDGGIPKKEYKSIQIEINSVKIELPNIALKNLYEPSLYNSKANYDKKNDILYILSSNSDGAGGYEIIWIIEKKKYKYRIEVYGF